MRRDQLIHLVRAAARVTGEAEVVVVGTAALLGSCAELPDALDPGDHADLFARERPEAGEEVDRALGEDSMYHEERGVWARGVGPMTPLAPAGWLDRLVPLDAGEGVVARCMEPHDLALAKLAVARGKDLDFCVHAIEHRIVELAELQKRILRMPVDVVELEELARTLERVTG